MAKLSKIAVVLALVFSLGAHWAVLQSVAWVSMFVRYSHEGSLAQALNKTFDGRHPCEICHFIASGKQTDGQKPNQVLKAPQIDWFVQSPPSIILLQMDAPRVAPSEEFWLPRFERPPLPPPRDG